MKLTYVQQPVASQYVEVELYEKSPVWLGWLNLLITLANETFIIIIFDHGNCIVTKKNCKINVSVAGVIKKFTVKYKYNWM